MKFHHIGIACENLEETRSYISSHFGLKEASEIVYDPLQDAQLQMLLLEDGTQIELISGNAVKTYVKKRQFLYHICFGTEDIEQKIAEMVESGDFLVREPREAVLFDNRRVAFLMTKMGMVELVEERCD